MHQDHCICTASRMIETNTCCKVLQCSAVLCVELQNRSWELCHGMGHHTALLAQFYRRPSKPLEKPKKRQLNSPKTTQLCPLPPSPYAAAPPPTCPSHLSDQGRSCCQSVIPSPLLSRLHDPIHGLVFLLRLSSSRKGPHLIQLT